MSRCARSFTPPRLAAAFAVAAVGLALWLSWGPQAGNGRRAAPPPPGEGGTPTAATFSIVGFDPETGDLGCAVASKVLAVGAVVPWARADVGAIATQAWANVDYGPEGLALLAQGKSAKETLDALVQADPERGRRQLAIVDARGRVAAWTGEGCFAWAGDRQGEHYSCQGNILVGQPVLDAMGEAFEKTEGSLASKLMAALTAGDEAGGDRRGRQSAAIYVVRREGGYANRGDRHVDLRVDDHREPVKELARLVALHRQFYRGQYRDPPPRREPAPEKKPEAEKKPARERQPY